MCAVSNIGDYGRQEWPTRTDWEEFKKLLDKAKEFDEKTGQPDCEAEEKTALMQAMEGRIKALEGAQAERPFFDFGPHIETLRDVASHITKINEAVGFNSGPLNHSAERLRQIANLMEAQLDR